MLGEDAGVSAVLEDHSLNWAHVTVHGIVHRDFGVYSEDIVHSPVAGADDWDIGGGIGENDTTEFLKLAKYSLQLLCSPCTVLESSPAFLPLQESQGEQSKHHPQ